MARATNRAVFIHSMLPDARPRWDFFGAGFGLQIILLAAVIIVPLLMPQRLQLYQRYWTTPIEAPPIVAWKPQPPPPPPKPVKIKQPEVVKEVPKPVVVEPPKPKIINPVFSSPVAKPATAKKNTPSPNLPEVAKAFPPATNPSANLGSSAMPTIRKPREEVQTGGFGDPNGVPANNRPGTHAPNIATLGSYDMPTGPGYGNGTGGAKGAKGVVASTGFGNGVANPPSGNGGHGTVQSAGFADEHATAAPRVKPAASVAPKATPVEVLFKPKPVYSDVAKAKKIEGEVLLQVTFTASGDVRVERVVQGLGYGLDESAENAARQIRFKPATANGQAVDSTAIVHIVFQVAN